VGSPAGDRPDTRVERLVLVPVFEAGTIVGEDHLPEQVPETEAEHVVVPDRPLGQGLHRGKLIRGEPVAQWTPGEPWLDRGLRDDTLAALRSIRCDLAQGYFFARPMPIGQLASRLTSGSPPRTLEPSR